MTDVSMKELAELMAGLSGLELLRAGAAMPSEDLPPNISQLFGFEFGEVEFGRVSVSLVTQPMFASPLGVLHGGVCATMLDSVMGSAVHSTLKPGQGYGTLELKVNLVRSVPVDGQRLTAVGTTIHIGRSTATAEGRVVDQEGRLVAHGSTTCMIYGDVNPSEDDSATPSVASVDVQR